MTRRDKDLEEYSRIINDAVAFAIASRYRAQTGHRPKTSDFIHDPNGDRRTPMEAFREHVQAAIDVYIHHKEAPAMVRDTKRVKGLAVALERLKFDDIMMICEGCKRDEIERVYGMLDSLARGCETAIKRKGRPARASHEFGLMVSLADVFARYSGIEFTMTIYSGHKTESTRRLTPFGEFMTAIVERLEDLRVWEGSLTTLEERAAKNRKKMQGG